MPEKLVLIGNYNRGKNNGPTGVIKGLIKGFEENDFQKYELLLYEKGDNKIQYIIKVIKNVIGVRGQVVNVHTDGYLIPFIVYILSFLNRNNKYYLTCHGIGKIENERGESISKKNLFLEKILYKGFPNLICVSEMQKKDILDLYKRKKKVIVIENGTDAWNYRIDLSESKKVGKIRIISLGGLSECKGLYELLDLCKDIQDNDIEYQMDIYGTVRDESQMTDFQGKLEKLGIEKSVKYQKYITDKQELYRTIQKYDVMFCLSKYDTFNVAIIEAIALGCICIASSKCGAADIIKRENLGMVYENENSKEILCYLKNLLSDPNYRNEIRKKGLLLETQYSWKGISKKYIDMVKYE